MARINNIVKFVTWVINNVIMVIGCVGLILSVYVIFADWGGLDTSFFLGLGVTGALMSGCLMHISTLGVLSIDFQNYTFRDSTPENTVWTGKKIILIYLICVIFALLFTCFATMYITNEVTSLEATLNAIGNGEFIVYDDFEVEVSKKFNEFFFGVVDTCQQLNLVFFWDFILENCPDSIDESHCSACTSNWLTTCAAHENSCTADYDVTVVGGGSESVPHQTCPYEICRTGIINFVIEQMDIILMISAALVGFFGLLCVLATMLLCYHERDSNEVYLEKAGAMARKRSKKNIADSSRSLVSDDSNGSLGKGSSAKKTLTVDSSATPRGSAPKTNVTPRAAQPTKKAGGK